MLKKYFKKGLITNYNIAMYARKLNSRQTSTMVFLALELGIWAHFSWVREDGIGLLSEGGKDTVPLSSPLNPGSHSDFPEMKHP